MDNSPSAGFYSKRNLLESNAPAIEAKELTKVYGQLTAVDHINFSIRKGEFFGFLGPNGAGKTTTARMLTGVIKSSAGEAQVMGYPAGSFNAKQLSGVMPEVSNAYMDLTGWGNLMLIAELYRVPARQARERAGKLLEQLGLLERKDSPASTYSMGMRKRLVLCLALLPDPRILFLDEPTSGLDVQSVRFIRALLKNLKQQGKTIFFTTHNMEEAADMCDRVAIINHGKIVAMDTPDNLSITAGRLFLIDVSFEVPPFARPVNSEELSRLPGVNRLENAQAIEEAERLRTQQAMLGAARARMQSGGPGGSGPPPEMMRRMQQMMQQGGGPPPDMQNMRKLIEADGGPTPEMRNLMGKIMQEGGPSPERMAEMMTLIEERKKSQAAEGTPAGAARPAESTQAEQNTLKKPEISHFRLYTENTTLLVASLVDFSRANSLTMNILNIRPPSLEDAFVRLTEEKRDEK